MKLVAKLMPHPVDWKFELNSLKRTLGQGLTTIKAEQAVASSLFLAVVSSTRQRPNC